MQKLSFDQIERLEGGAWIDWVNGAACGAGILGAVVLLSNPVTMTAGVYLASVGSGVALGACAGLLVY
ncbi:hypothetical protein QWY85_09870 [Neolewinella lacunae]|uniref:Bacteriocin n=1 Tax=Neolewinella lacunae TaxID=1517758 RepID=A0A923PH01_9BACT|nr:hypothetical protein [Neolewinella lacunae]MBC6993953.1 hypothetical protein [Neolewinella lacunae]MDN3634966.1 hypothetical protein [Neolewinella lacunae]